MRKCSNAIYGFDKALITQAFEMSFAIPNHLAYFKNASNTEKEGEKRQCSSCNSDNIVVIVEC